MEQEALKPWLVPVLHLLLGVSLVYGHRSLYLAAFAYMIYWIVRLERIQLSGDYMTTYNTGHFIAGGFLRLINGAFFTKTEDFTRMKKPCAKASGEKRNEKKACMDSGNPGTHRSRGQKFLDALEVGFAATRGVGWKYQVKGIPPGKPARYPRRKFVLENIFAVVWRFVAIDLISSYLRTTPMGQPFQAEQISATPVPVRLFRGVLFVGSAWSIEMAYGMIAALSVGVGLYDPSDWPPIMGSLKEAYSVRRFWSHKWHQMMRAIAEPPINYLADLVLHILKGSYWSNYLRVFWAFFMAGTTHAYATHLAGGDPAADWTFFMSHAVAVWLEETVIQAAKASGVRGDSVFVRLIGYVWTASFVICTVTLWQEKYAYYGAYSAPPFGFSVVDFVTKRID